MKLIDIVDVFELKHDKNMVKRCTIDQIIGAVICNCKNDWLQHYICSMTSFVFNDAQRTKVMFFVEYKTEIKSFRKSVCVFWMCGLYKECGFHK